MRGTSMYYEAAKRNLMATLRQKGAPTLFITLSSAEYQWEGLLKSVYETVHGELATDEIIKSMSPAEKNRLITDNVVQTTVHFQKRIEKIITKLMQPGFLEKSTNPNTSNLPPNPIPSNTPKGQKEDDDSNPSYFYRIEFQARGAPHVHLLAWLKDKNGVPAPSLLISNDENIEQNMCDIAEYHDSIIQCLVEENEDQTLKDNIEKFQFHTCGFTCHKRKKTITIRANEGHAFGETNMSKMIELPHVPVCRFLFPRAPMDKTTVLLGFNKDESEELIKAAKLDYLAIRKYLIRQTHVPDNSRLEDQVHYKNL
jgi:hypothetical protein